VNDFTQFGLLPALERAIAETGYATPTPIQMQAIPLALSGKDVIGLAQTGTGKTAAFALPILNRLAADPRPTPPKGCRALVLAPTRELAAQIKEAFRTYGAHLNLRSTVIFGGVPMGRQKDAMARGVDILVATPGRLIDLADQRALRLYSVEVLVLDEADHMLDIGFIHALRDIAGRVPKARQTLFFSATMPPAIAELAQRFLTDPQKVAVAPQAATAERVAQRVIHVATPNKPQVLSDLLADENVTRAIVFTRTKHGADRVVRRLLATGVGAEAIHGNKSQGQRERALAAFKYGKARVLVATEIAARGIDVDEVTHVINFELPNVPEQYVHRIGRTARAGADGLAISLCAPDERAYLKDIEKVTRQKVEVLEHPLSLPAPAADAPASAPSGRNRRGGGRGRPQEAPRRTDRPDRPERSEQQPRAPRSAESERPRAAAEPARAPKKAWSPDEPARRDGQRRDERRNRNDNPRGEGRGQRQGQQGQGQRREHDQDHSSTRRRGGEEIWSNHSESDRAPRALARGQGPKPAGGERGRGQSGKAPQRQGQETQNRAPQNRVPQNRSQNRPNGGGRPQGRSSPGRKG
jgi:ATP-dependent RNA helicase RhlE